MGCGRSRHRSPSPVLHDGNNKENTNSSSNKQRGGKRQKLADKDNLKSAGKTDASNSTPTKTTNGKTASGGGVKADWQAGSGDKLKNDWSKGGGGTTDSPVRGESTKETTPKRQWQLEEAVDSQPETVMAVFRSSVPASARASLNSAPSSARTHNVSSFSTAAPPNGSLHNGSQYRAAATMPHDLEMQIEVPEKATLKERNASSNAKPVHCTSSQLEFFKMLDEKIEKGPDYDSDFE